MNTSTKFCKDTFGKDIKQKLYRIMTRSLLYLTTSQPNIFFSVGACACYRSCPKESHLTPVKRIICYVSGTIEYGLIPYPG